MKAVRIHEHGDLEVLKIVDLPEPQAGPGELLVQIKASGLNHLDTWVRRGVPGHRFPLPITPGSDGAGIVAASGSPDFAVGERVAVAPGFSCGLCAACLSGQDQYCRRYGIYGETADGTQCEYFVLPPRNALRIPDALSFEEAAAVPLAFLTAWEMLMVKAGLREGDTVLVHAAGSGVGSAAIQIARYFNARVIATAGSEGKCAKAVQLGAESAINYREQDFAAELHRLTGRRGADIVLDHVGAATFAGSLRCLARRGRLVCCGATSGPEISVNLRPVFFKNLAIIGSTMGSRGTLPRILELVAQGAFRPVIDRVMPMTEVAQAHRLLAEREPFGKIILRP